jgi:hypothetical protein
MKHKYSKVIYDQLQQMEIEESFNKEHFILTYWDDFDYFTNRSFRVIFCKVKKLLPERKFKTEHGHITRIA